MKDELTYDELVLLARIRARLSCDATDDRRVRAARTAELDALDHAIRLARRPS